MRYSVARLNVTYERPFKQPVFEASKSAAEILGNFYSTLNPTYPLKMSDLTATSALSMGDIAIRVSLFSGNGLLDLSIDKFTAMFEGLRLDQDVEVIKDVIVKSESVLSSSLPNIDFKGTNIKTSAWLICEDGAEAARYVLDRYGAPKVGLAYKKLGAGEIKIPVRGVITNKNEGWSTNFLIDLSEMTGAHLFFLCGSSYEEGGKYSNFVERSGHFESIYRNLLENHELQPISNDKDT